MNMITIKYETINRQSFTMAMQKLARTPLPVKVAYQVKKISEDIDKNRKDIGKRFFDEVMEKFAAKDDTGAWKHPESDPQGFVIPDDKQSDFHAAEEEFGKNTFTVDRNPISLDDLSEHIKFSASELAAIEEVVLPPTV